MGLALQIRESEVKKQNRFNIVYPTRYYPWRIKYLTILVCFIVDQFGQAWDSGLTSRHTLRETVAGWSHSGKYEVGPTLLEGE